MDKSSHVCPHCRAAAARIVSDRLGSVGWCAACHHTWIPAARPPAAKAPDKAERLRAAG